MHLCGIVCCRWQNFYFLLLLVVWQFGSFWLACSGYHLPGVLCVGRGLWCGWVFLVLIASTMRIIRLEGSWFEIGDANLVVFASWS